MTKPEVIELLAGQEYVERMVMRIAHSSLTYDLQDLSQMVYEYLIRFREDYFMDIWNKGEMNFLVARIIVNQLYSGTSPYYRGIRKFRERSEDIGRHRDDWKDE